MVPPAWARCAQQSWPRAGRGLARKATGLAGFPVAREALRSALMPIINSMAATGIVSLPGMMTGQILGGVLPAEAVKYQVLVMFLIAGGTGLGAVMAVLGGIYRLTDARHRLRLNRLTIARTA
jgi:putative ABC transport system permease protein